MLTNESSLAVLTNNKAYIINVLFSNNYHK